VQWPVTEAGGTARLFTDGGFQTPDGRARMNPVQPRGPANAASLAFPMALNTGRIRDQWHTMTRTGLAADLWRHIPEPYVEVHPADAEPLGIREGGLTRIETPHGEAVVIARLSDRQRRGSLFLPMHWSEAFAASGRANPLVNPAVDPESGQPEFKHTPARARPYRETWRGFFLSREGAAAPAGADLVWRSIRRDGAWLNEFAGRGDAEERAAVRRALLRGASGERVVFEDPAVGALREAWLVGGRLERVLFTTATGKLPPRDWLAELFEAPVLTAEARASLLHGWAPGARVDAGPQVCACLRVGARTIAAAIDGGACTVDAVGAATGAGTNCGSCRPEIARLLAAAPKPEPRKEETRHAA
jgi:assimilatory nitrate reductase catalytic subunit